MTHPDDPTLSAHSEHGDAVPRGEQAPAQRVDALDADEPGVFPPTLREVMLRPWWIGMLLLCLVVAGVFAWLGQWQLGRAIDTDRYTSEFPVAPATPIASGIQQTWAGIASA